MQGVTPKSEKKEKNKKTPKSENKSKSNDATPGTPGQSQKKQTLEGGVIAEELKGGNGPIAKPGRMVRCFVLFNFFLLL